MNVGEFLKTVNVMDVIVVLFLFGMFILGFAQGSIRRLIGILAMTFSFFLAALLQGNLQRAQAALGIAQHQGHLATPAQMGEIAAQLYLGCFKFADKEHGDRSGNQQQ